ncbi:MAG: hypothetical protein KAH77_10370 [Thiomargarita sp.]|nr:hypothetical protein [Thiomargarita sp.]
METVTYSIPDAIKALKQLSKLEYALYKMKIILKRKARKIRDAINIPIVLLH